MDDEDDADTPVAAEVEDEELEDESSEGDNDADGDQDEDEDGDGDGDEEEEGSEDGDEVAVEDEDEDEDEDEEDEVTIVPAAKTRSRQSKARVDSEDEISDENGGEDSEESDGDTSKDEHEAWDDADDAEDDRKIGQTDSTLCVFCGEDEENDPSEEFEEYLACCVCGNSAHRQCARNANSLNSDDDAARWRCQHCVANGLQEEFKHVSAVLSTRRRSSAPKMARDLLPAARGGIKPGSHSVFNTLILPDDEMDGTRALRKRKTPSEDVEETPRLPIRKRRKTISPNGPNELPGVEENAVDALDGTAEEQSPPSRSGRPLRNLKPRKRGLRIISQSEDPKSMVVAIPITVAQWDQIERDVLKKQRRRERDRERRARSNRHTHTAEPEEPQHFPAVQTAMYTNPFYPFPERETDENKGKPYGGILTDAEADTARTYPQEADRQAFQNARDHAEEEWKERVAQINGDTAAKPKASGPPSKIKCINFGQYEIDTWHAAPYPEEYSRNKHLYICEFCLKYMSSDYVAWRHKLKCSAKAPPGDEIYRNSAINPESGTQTTLSFFEVDGRRNPLYCQNLCLLAKLFLGSKTLYYDVEPFLFYIMTENDDYGCHFVGYFSKEKRGSGPPPSIPQHLPTDHSQDGSTDAGQSAAQEGAAADPALSLPGNNVSCILVLPVYMRRGFGRVLIEFSYLLTRVEGRTGSPEKPLSDMGLVSYRSYWRTVICQVLLRLRGKEAELNQSKQLSIARIAQETGMTPDDIISTLEALRFLVRDPITSQYALRLDYEYMREYVDKHEKKATVRIDPARLCWTPYVMGKPTNLFAMGEETNQPLQTVAPRDEPVETSEDAEETQSQPATGNEEGFSHDGRADPGAIDTREVSRANSVLLKSGPGTAEFDSASHPPHHRTPNGIDYDESGGASPASFESGLQQQQQQHLLLSAAGGSGDIPPTRFEIFPPLPGMASASVSSKGRRPGRRGRGGSGRRSGYGTPARRSASRRQHSAGRPAAPLLLPPATASTRRTRSKLGDLALAVGDNDDDDDDGAPDEVGPVRRGGGAATSPNADAAGDDDMGVDGTDADAPGEEEDDDDDDDDEEEDEEEEEIQYE